MCSLSNHQKQRPRVWIVVRPYLGADNSSGAGSSGPFFRGRPAQPARAAAFDGVTAQPKEPESPRLQNFGVDDAVGQSATDIRTTQSPDSPTQPLPFQVLPQRAGERVPQQGASGLLRCSQESESAFSEEPHPTARRCRSRVGSIRTPSSKKSSIGNGPATRAVLTIIPLRATF